MFNKLKLLMRFMRGSGMTYAISIVAVLFMTVFGAVTPLVIKTTVDSIIGDEPLNLPSWTKNIMEQIGGLAFIRQNLWTVLILLVAITVLQGIFMYLKGKLSAVAAQESSKRVREKLYDHLMHLPFDYHVKAQTGDIVQRCTSDIETVQNFVSGQLIEALQIIMQVIVVMGIMISMSFKYTLISIVLIPIILVITIRFFINMMKIFLQTDEAEGIMSTALQENLTGVRVVKAFGAQNFEMEKFDEKNRNYKNLNLKIVELMADFWSGTDLLCMLQHALVLTIGTFWVVEGDITIGTLIAFSSYAGMLVWPLRSLGQMMGFMGQAFVSLGRIHEILDTKPEDYTEGRKDVPIHGEIVFDNVRFEYEPGKPILNGLSFKIEKGTTVAILGATGSGKSSLVHLLLRLYDYQGGHITIDGVELSQISREWIRKHVGIVLQEPFLFSRNIRENIRIGDASINDEDICRAAQTASIHDAILEFEKGYDTIVGERGVTLSGGQRQRVAIARTVAKDVPILIFDDSLSAVDTETDAQIRQALRERRKDTTTIIISHRITTLAEADKILVLDKGCIVESGSHEELIAKEGLYKKIWEIQSSLGEDLVEAMPAASV
jgi:ATP-binding cassette subfamily B protein